MNKIKQIGVIECGNPAQLFQLPEINKSQGYIVSKIFYNNDTAGNISNSNHPEAEVVSNKEAIIDDTGIDMVIISSPSDNEMNIVGEVLKANKPARIV